MGWVKDYDWEEDEPYVNTPATPEVERSRRKVRRLYGPNGEVFASFSNKPPVGFHQGGR